MLRLVLYFKETSTFSSSLLCSDVSISAEGGFLMQQPQRQSFWRTRGVRRQKIMPFTMPSLESPMAYEVKYVLTIALVEGIL